MPITRKKFEELLINIQYDFYRKEELDLSDQDLGDNQAIELASAIRKNSYIKRVNLSHNRIGSQGAKVLKSLPLQELNLSNNNTEELLPQEQALEEVSERKMSEESSLVESGTTFKEALKKIQDGSHQRECFTWCNAKLDDDDAIELAKALQHNKKITGLVLDGNSIGDKGVKALTAVPHLRYLGLAGNLVGPEGAQRLAKSALTGLDLAGNRRLGDKGAIALAKSKTLEILNISYCKIGNKGAAAIFGNPTLETLDMSENRIDEDGVENVRCNEGLVTLNLSHNNIGSKGAKAIAANTHLKRVCLESSSIDDRGAEHLAKSRTISELDLTRNSVGEQGFLALCKNQVIQKLSLFSNDVCFNQKEPLPQAAALIELNLSFNKIKDSPEEPLRSFADAFPKLTTLSLVDNEMGRTGALIFSQVKEKQPLLQKLDISGPDIPKELSSFEFPW